MKCNSCGSQRMASVNAKCNDLFSISTNGREYSGYVLKESGLGSGDYIEFSYCLHCGKIEGKFPRVQLEIEGELEKCDECGMNAIEHSKEFYRKYCTACGAIPE